MKKLPFLKHYNWKIILIRILVSAFAIGLVAFLIPQIYFVKITLVNLLIIGLALGILNALVKPALMFLTAQLFFATFGLLIILINAFLLYLLDRIFPSIFVVQSLLWVLIGGALLGLVGNSFENLLGVYPVSFGILSSPGIFWFRFRHVDRRIHPGSPDLALGARPTF